MSLSGRIQCNPFSIVRRNMHCHLRYPFIHHLLVRCKHSMKVRCFRCQIYSSNEDRRTCVGSLLCSPKLLTLSSKLTHQYRLIPGIRGRARAKVQGVLISRLAAKLELLPYIPNKCTRSNKVDRRVENFSLTHLSLVQLLEIEHEVTYKDRSQASNSVSVYTVHENCRLHVH